MVGLFQLHHAHHTREGSLYNLTPFIEHTLYLNFLPIRIDFLDGCNEVERWPTKPSSNLRTGDTRVTVDGRSAEYV